MCSDGTPVLDVKPWVSDFDLPARRGTCRPGRAPAGSTPRPQRPLTLDDPAALVLVARELTGRLGDGGRGRSCRWLGSACSR